MNTSPKYISTLEQVLILIGKNSFNLLGGLMVGYGCPWKKDWELTLLTVGLSLIGISIFCLIRYFKLLKTHRWPNKR